MKYLLGPLKRDSELTSAKRPWTIRRNKIPYPHNFCDGCFRGMLLHGYDNRVGLGCVRPFCSLYLKVRDDRGPLDIYTKILQLFLKHELHSAFGGHAIQI